MLSESTCLGANSHKRKFQQIAILIGAAASALALGPVLLMLNDAGTVYVPIEKVAPGLHAPVMWVSARSNFFKLAILARTLPRC